MSRRPIITEEPLPRYKILDAETLQAAEEIARCNAAIQDTPFSDDEDRYSESKDDHNCGMVE